MDMEVCCTLGCSPKTKQNGSKIRFVCIQPQFRFFQGFYKDVISTREYEQVNTIENARKAGISVCSGGIIGMGESEVDY